MFDPIDRGLLLKSLPIFDESRWFLELDVVSTATAKNKESSHGSDRVNRGGIAESSVIIITINCKVFNSLRSPAVSPFALFIIVTSKTELQCNDPITQESKNY